MMFPALDLPDVDRPAVRIEKGEVGGFFESVWGVDSSSRRRRAIACPRFDGYLEEEGLQGVMAKRPDLGYRFGERDGMRKVKHLRTVDCVVGGYRMSGDRMLLVLGLFHETYLPFRRLHNR